MIMKYIVYQTPVNTSYCFMPFKYAIEHKLSRGDYVPVWRGEIESETVNGALEEIFELLNVNRPEHFCGRSLSVSDVVVLEGKPFYCDSFGWSEIPPENWNR